MRFAPLQAASMFPKINYKQLLLDVVGKNLAGELVLPEITYVGRTGLAYNQSLTRLELPNCTSSDTDLCAGCINVKYISVPKLINVKNSSFAYCNNLEEIHLDSAVSFGVQVFLSSSKLKQIYCPNVESVSNTWCNGNTQLTDIYATNRTTSQILAMSVFPGFVNMDSVFGNITWHCNDGTVIWNGSAWIANNS